MDGNGEPRATPGPTARRSRDGLLLAGVRVRLAVAGGLAACLWLGFLWAIGPVQGS